MNLTLNLNWKTKLMGLAVGLMVGIGAWYSTGLGARSVSADANVANSIEPLPNLQGQAAVDYLKQRGLYDSLKAKIEAIRHEIRWVSKAGSPASGGAWQAINPGQNLRASFSPAGVLLAPTQSCNEQAAWQISLRLRGIGYGERLSQVSSGPMRIRNNRIEIPQIANRPYRVVCQQGGRDRARLYGGGASGSFVGRRTAASGD